MKNITVIGCGTMGSGIAHLFALHQFNVAMVDVNEEALKAAMQSISINLDRQAIKGVISESAKKSTLRNITTYTGLQQAVEHADLVIEAVTENIAVKLDLFRQLSKHCSADTILASNTSSISITELASVTKHPGNVIGMHFMNPVPIMQLVEVIRGKQTIDKVTATIMQLATSMGKIPVEVNDSPGFVANRIVMPMINEAIYTLYESVAGVEDIDMVMKLGMAHPMGPLQLADFIGLDVCLAILNVLHSGFENPKYAPCPLLIEMVKAGQTGHKGGEGFYRYTPGSKDLIVAPKFTSVKLY